jgi:hypothetical protein
LYFFCTARSALSFGGCVYHDSAPLLRKRMADAGLPLEKQPEKAAE